MDSRGPREKTSQLLLKADGATDNVGQPIDFANLTKSLVPLRSSTFSMRVGLRLQPVEFNEIN
jgi:hypothetical protein